MTSRYGSPPTKTISSISKRVAFATPPRCSPRLATNKGNLPSIEAAHFANKRMLDNSSLCAKKLSYTPSTKTAEGAVRDQHQLQTNTPAKKAVAENEKEAIVKTTDQVTSQPSLLPAGAPDHQQLPLHAILLTAAGILGNGILFVILTVINLCAHFTVDMMLFKALLAVFKARLNFGLIRHWLKNLTFSSKRARVSLSIAAWVFIVYALVPGSVWMMTKLL